MNKIFTSVQTKQLDQYTIQNEPVSHDALMERASFQCFRQLIFDFPHQDRFLVLVGPGNNGGDGLVIARLLAAERRKVKVCIVKSSSSFSEMHVLNLKRLIDQGLTEIFYIENKNDFPVIRKEECIIDALFGSGLSKPIIGLYAEFIQYVNQCDALKIAIDIPSGLFDEDNTNNDSNAIFMAHFTYTFESPFLSFFFAENEKYIGRWRVLPIGLHEKAKASIDSSHFILEPKDVNINTRKIFSHKGTYGHGLLIAGSKGMMGASIMSSKACLRCGIGLLTVHIPESGNAILQSSVPEAMTSIDNEFDYISTIPDLSKYDAVAVGCGLGKNDAGKEMLLTLLNSCKKPLIIDADALNLIAENNSLVAKIPANTVLTPHPGEFDRLFGKSENASQRFQRLKEVSVKHQIIIVLKGAFTAIAFPDARVLFNSTGNPGMATAGSGDVLTGMILSFIAQNYSIQKAVINAVYLHGLAGDIAADCLGENSLLAGDIINNIAPAFKRVQENSINK